MPRPSLEVYLVVNPPDKHAPSKSLDGEGGVADPQESPAHPQHPVLALQGDGSPRPPQALKKPEMHRSRVSRENKLHFFLMQLVLNQGERKNFCPMWLDGVQERPPQQLG